MKYLKLENPDRTWILDIEADSLTPTVIWCVVVKNVFTGEVLSFTEKEEFNEWNKRCDRRYIGHNVLSFDIPTLIRLWGSDISLYDAIDTLVLSYLYNPALLGGHSLSAWGGRLKFPKGEFSDFFHFSEQMLRYCIQDVELTYRVYQALTKKMLSLGYSEFSCNIEHKIKVIIDKQQRNGFWFDRIGATRLSEHIRGIQSDLTSQIQILFPPRRTKIEEYRLRRTKDGGTSASYERHLQKYSAVGVDGVTPTGYDIEYRQVPGIPEQGVPPEEYYTVFEMVPFNLGSPKQRVERLLEIGWKPEKFTKNKTEEYPLGFPKVDEDALVAFAKESGRAEVQALAEWLVIQGRASMIDTWMNNLGEDSRIHGRIFTCGATTRRMTHSNPNTANIPSGAKAKYGHECRALWGVEPDKGLVLVGYDAAGLETAGLCHYLNNPRATEILLRPKPDDIHTANSKRLTEALGWPVDREWGAKTSWYAWLYGAFPPKLGSIVGASKNGMPEAKAGEVVVETFFRNVPGLKKLIKDVQNEFRANNGRIRTVDGGYVICPSLNAALNYLVQSMGAILMKLASIILDEEANKRGLPFKKVADIHDEAQLEVEKRYAEDLGKLAVWSIEEAGRRLKLNVPVTGSYLIGKTWAKTH